MKAECIKNAAKSFGNHFGRNLNREDEFDYEPLSDQVEEIEQKRQIALEKLNNSTISEQDPFKKEIQKANSKRLDDIIIYLEKNQIS